MLSGVPAFGAKLADYAVTSCYGCAEVPTVLVVLWVALVRGG